MLKEVCVENFTKVPEAIEKGARRVELCDNLAVGGTTVSPGVARVTLDYCRSRNVKVMSMIRPRGGDFVYNVDEIEIMKRDIIHLKESGTDGVVFGCLTQDGWIDEEAMVTLLEVASGLEVVFHMAFDAITAESQLKAIDWLVEHGVHRILTHGGSSDTKIEDNVDRLKAYVEHANGRIAILPGGGVTSRNLENITSSLGVKEAHGTRIVD
ncbi:copper homeostasis protein CutC [Rossellomorea marisflavi]|uniref:copper homeostasis protein CutC n=1 Tax=Rossellomorea marisflavi TaxID=189381 RepID=UPI00064EC4A3|nr:copper homeostasis protein CutC [Rossellomorea marisflavi]KML32238.1 copper homeostasis protein CutC [Rossellomorea marisflavi]TYO73993.1 copper homeostasis protein CutC [Rossellomorea marisflavi]